MEIFVAMRVMVAVQVVMNSGDDESVNESESHCGNCNVF